MTIRVRVSGALQTITGGKVKVAGVVRSLRSIKVMDGGTLRTVATFASPLSLSISPTSVAGTASSGTAVTVTTTTATATPSGGLGPFTYAWTFISKTGGDTPTAFSPSFATSAFQQANVAALENNSSVFRCTVTDSFGTTATADVTTSFVNFGASGGS